MKKIINWLKKTRAWKWAAEEVITAKRWMIKTVTVRAFKIILWSRKHAQDNYDMNIISLYKGVRKKKAFVFKTKIISPGKGIKHYKLLLVETPHGVIEVQLMREEHPDFFKYDNVEQEDN